MLLLQNGGAICRVCSEGASALPRCGELVGLPEVLFRVLVVDPIMEPSRTQCVPRIDAQRTAICRARIRGQYFSFAALVAYRCEIGWCGSVAKDYGLDLDRRDSRPGCGVVGKASCLAGHTESV